MFDDQQKIETIQLITPYEIEVAYWKLEDYISAGEIKNAKVLFDMMCYLGKHRSKDFTTVLKKTQIERLHALSYQIEGNDVPDCHKAVQELHEIKPVELPFAKEKEINLYIYNHEHLLKDLGNGRISGREIEIEGYFCDIVYETKDTLFAIELKRDQVDHKAVSQLDKYCHYFYLKLRYNHYKQVKGACIGNGYDKWAINELRRKGRTIFCITPEDKNNISLRRII